MKGIVLVVDDDQGIRDLLRDLLEILGYQVFEAENGVKALAELIHVTPDLIILDNMMPVMDGMTFVQELHRRHLAYPLLACSATDTAHSFAEQIGAIGFLVKPFHISQLLNVLSQWMSTHQP